MCSFLQVVDSTPNFHLMSQFLKYDNNFVLKTIEYCINTKSMGKLATLEILSIEDIFHLISKVVVQYFQTRHQNELWSLQNSMQKNSHQCLLWS